MIDLYRMQDRIRQWWRYPQPTQDQRRLLGLHTDSFDLDFVAQRLAAETSAHYMTQHMRQARNFATDYDLHQWIVSEIDCDLAQEGLFLEFGVATGRTINHWARLLPQRVIHGFDGFQGLPEHWSWRMRQGHFGQALPRVRENVRLVVGWFNQTLEQFLQEHAGAVAFLHIDCDLYSSTHYVLAQLAPRLREGTVIVFDEYFNFPGWQEDEFRAWQEFAAHNHIQYEYLGFVSRHQQVAIRITKIG